LSDLTELLLASQAGAPGAADRLMPASPRRRCRHPGYAHGLHDPIGNWSTEIREGQYWCFIAGGAGPGSGTAAREAEFRSRFAGRIVEVTVHS
jgi:hypothetical protein